MSFCHINYTTGLRMPVRELCDLARQHGIITLVDGAHATGMIDYDLHELGCDFYATALHKWLCGPPGTGALYMRREAQDQLTPTVSELYLKSGGCIVYQMRGQQTTPAFAAVLDVIDFQNEIGKDTIEKRVMALNRYLKEKIIENWGEESLYSPMDEELSTGIVSFNPFRDHFASEGISAIFEGLWDRNILTRTITFKNRLSDRRQTSLLRISTHIYNNYRQVDTVIDAMKDIIPAIA